MTRWLLALLMLAFLAFHTPADDERKASKKAQDNAKTVAKTLRSHLPPLSGGGKWDDFQLRIVDKIGDSDYATAAGWEQWADGSETPYIQITSAYLWVYGTHSDAVALLIGREFGSLVLGHVPRKGVEPPGGGACASRRRQADAELFAAELLLKSGYSLRAAIGQLKRELIILPEKVRPMMAERIERLQRLSDPGEELWRASPAYDTGLMFLALAEYELALTCFERLSVECPKWDEVQAAAAIAKLQTHWFYNDDRCRGLYVLGTPTTKTSAKFRGRPPEWWFAAVGELRKANERKSNQPAVLAHLGLAYLLHPRGEKEGLPEAEKYLLAALKIVKESETPDVGAVVTLLVNLGVAKLADGKLTDARKLFDEAATLAEKLPAAQRARVTRALIFNRALALATEGKHAEAARLFVQYLETTPREDLWWAEGYKHYQTACKAAKIEPQAKDRLQKPGGKKALAVTLANGKTVAIGDDFDETLTKLGKPTQTTPAVPQTTLKRLRFEAHGIELFTTQDEVCVIVLVPKGAQVKLPDAGGKPAGSLRLGMTRKTIESLPGCADAALRPFLPSRPGVWVYYPALGVAVVYDRDGPDGVVTSILVGTER